MSSADRWDDFMERGAAPESLKPLRLPPGMRWRANDAAGVGHLLARGGIRYLCNAMPVVERFAWPVKERCAGCVRVLEAGRS